MIVVYTRKWNVVRIEDAIVIDIIDLEKGSEYQNEAIKHYKELAEEVSKESVLFRDRVFGRITHHIDLRTANLCYQRMGYKYLFVVDVSSFSFSFPTKELGDQGALEKLKSSKEKIKYVRIDEEKGLLEVE